MHTALSRTLLSCLVGILLGSCAGPEERAQQLLGEASRLVFSAQEAEKTSYADALPLYRQASAKAETITAHYALSPLAGKLTSGEAGTGMAQSASRGKFPPTFVSPPGGIPENNGGHPLAWPKVNVWPREGAYPAAPGAAQAGGYPGAI